MKKTVAISVEGNEPNLFLAVELEEEDIKELSARGVKLFEAEDEEKVEADFSKKSFAFLVPVFSMLPATATIVGAATLGIVGGAATVVGGRVVNWVWPNK